MIKLKYIVVFLFLTSNSCFSQTTFTNLDSLLFKNYEAVNKRDSVAYLSTINQALIFKDKSLKSKSDSIILFKPFTDAYRDLIQELADMTSSTDFTVKYIDYEFRNKNIKNTYNGQLLLHVNLLVNNTFTLKMPLVITSNNGQFTIDAPLAVMFVEAKE